MSIEKYYKNKFNESVFVINPEKKLISQIKDLESLVESEQIEKDNYKIIRPKRELSLFLNKCKYCEKSVIKQLDRTHYLRYDCCYECYVKFEEK